MTRDELRRLADRTLAPILGPVGFVSSDIDERPDHAGDASLYVTVHFARDARVANGRLYLDAQVAMARSLAQHGEERFPYLEYDYAEDSANEEEPEGTWLKP